MSSFGDILDKLNLRAKALKDIEDECCNFCDESIDDCECKRCNECYEIYKECVCKRKKDMKALREALERIDARVELDEEVEVIEENLSEVIEEGCLDKVKYLVETYNDEITQEHINLKGNTILR